MTPMFEILGAKKTVACYVFVFEEDAAENDPAVKSIKNTATNHSVASTNFHKLTLIISF